MLEFLEVNSKIQCKNKDCGEYFRRDLDAPHYVKWCSELCKKAIYKKVMEPKSAKKKKKKKEKSIAKLVDGAAVLLQKLTRMQAADELGYVTCVSCGVIKHYTEVDGGHFISRRYIATKLDPININCQCKKCNGFLGGNMVSYTLYMISTYGRHAVEGLNEKKNTIKKYTRDEVIEITADLKKQIKELEHLERFN